MKFKNIVNAALLVACLGGVAMAYIKANPAYTLVQPQSAQSVQSHVAKLVPSKHVFMDVDNVTGLRYDVGETKTSFVVRLKELSPDPASASHMTNPTMAAYAVVRYEGFGATTDYALTRVNANTWAVVIPKSAISLLPGDKFSLGAWAPGTDINNTSEAAYWFWWTL